MNLSTVGQDDMSTSEDEEKIKPVVPPRVRINGNDVKRLQNVTKVKTKEMNHRNGKKSEELDRTLTNDLDDNFGLDVSTVQRK